MKLYDLRTEYRENPIGLTDKAPRFSWKIESEEQNTIQTVYEINVTDEKGNVVWNSGKKASDQSVLISYEGEKLADEMLYKVEVSVADNHGNVEAIEGTFETGIFNNTEFIAKMITNVFPNTGHAVSSSGKSLVIIFAINSVLLKIPVSNVPSIASTFPWLSATDTSTL